MTTNEIIEYYSNLLIMQYNALPKAIGTIEALATEVIADQLPILVQDCFNVDTAEGVQLEIIGKYVGASRYGYNYSGAMVLTDAQYRTFIKLCILTNSSGSSLYDIQNLLTIFFPNTIFVFDYANMRMSYLLDSDIGSAQFAEFFILAGKLPKPMGVELGSVIYYPTTDQFFGFRTYASVAYNVNPFNTYASYDMTWPFLDYTMAL